MAAVGNKKLGGGKYKCLLKKTGAIMKHLWKGKKPVKWGEWDQEEDLGEMEKIMGKKEFDLKFSPIPQLGSEFSLAFFYFIFWQFHPFMTGQRELQPTDLCISSGDRYICGGSKASAVLMIHRAVSIIQFI